MFARIFSRKALTALTLTMSLMGFGSQALAQYEGEAGPVVGGIGHAPGHDPADGANTGDGEYQDGSNANFITYDQAEAITRALYRAVLFREGEDEGVQFWIEVILTSPGTEGLMAAASGFADSDEYRYQVLPQHSDQEILENIYQVFFNRSIDPSGAYTWGSLFEQGRHAEILRGIVGSEEFAQNFLR